MNYHEIRDKKQKDTNELFEKLGVFWAFSNEQFAEGVKAHPIAPGEKYASIGAGGYMPSKNVDSLIEGMKKINKDFKQLMKDTKLREKHILYELNNHECFYTGDITDAVEAMGEGFTREEVEEVMKKYKAKKYQRPTTPEDYTDEASIEAIEKVRESHCPACGSPVSYATACSNCA